MGLPVLDDPCLLFRPFQANQDRRYGLVCQARWQREKSMATVQHVGAAY